MLDKVPHEVILTISNFLTLNDKLILIRTCRHLFNVISNTNLFSNINLFSRQTTAAYSKKVETFLENFKKSGFSGSQVKILSINLLRTDYQLQVQLPILFPNIARISTNEYNELSPSNQNHSDQEILLLPWVYTLETYYMLHDWSRILPLLKTTTFPRLTDLELDHYCYLKDKSEGFDIPYFLPHIKNVPSLKRLGLRRCAIDLEFLDQVHVSCPQLESLRLAHSHIVIRNQALNQPVIPADSLLSLEIEKACCFDTNGLFLEYITRKYRCLKQLRLSFKENYDVTDFCMYYNSVIIMMYKNDNMDYNVENEHNPKVREYLDLFRSLTKELENTAAVYKESGQIFFSNLTKSTKSVAIHCDLFDNVIQTLTSSNIEPIKLEVIGSMEDLKQLQYIKDIEGLRSLKLETCVQEQDYSYHFPSNNITQLTLLNQSQSPYTSMTYATSINLDVKKSTSICISWVLSMFPSLEELSIDGRIEVTARETGVTKRFPKLKKLKSKALSMDQACLDYLKMTAPNIQDMSVRVGNVNGNTYDASITTYTSGTSIDVSEWDLKRLKLEAHNTFKERPFYCYISVPGRTKLLEYDDEEQSLAVVGEKSPSDYYQKLVEVSIISTNEKHFKFNGVPISLLDDKIAIDTF